MAEVLSKVVFERVNGNHGTQERVNGVGCTRKPVAVSRMTGYAQRRALVETVSFIVSVSVSLSLSRLTLTCQTVTQSTPVVVVIYLSYFYPCVMYFIFVNCDSYNQIHVVSVFSSVQRNCSVV